MQFFEDKKRGLLLYPTQAPFLMQALPDAKLINGQYLAVPNNLRNLQILRHYQHPTPAVMTDENYDWPIVRGRKPLPHQKLMANFMLLHPRCFNLSDMGCVAGDTLIETDRGAIPIAELEYRAKPIRVKALVGGKLAYVPATAPFVKGVDKLYEVRFASGRKITVTAKHFFLTCRGWVSCADLAVGEQLPKFDGALQESSSVSSLSALLLDAQRSFQKAGDCPERCGTLSCGAQLLQDEDTDQVLIPSPVGVQARNPFLLQTGDQGTKRKYTDPFYDDRLSKRHYICQLAKGRMEFLAFESTTTRADKSNHIYEQWHQSSTPVQRAATNQELLADCARYPAHKESELFERARELLGTRRPASWRHGKYPSRQPVNRALDPSIFLKEPSQEFPVDTVTHISYVKTDVYYDLHVPNHENYIAHGLCNHNTMKTISALWAADYLMRQHEPGTFRALIVAPLSTLQRVWGDTIFQNFLGHRTFEILHGDAAKRGRGLDKPADFYIINFDGVGIGAHTRKRLELDGFSQALAARDDIRLAIIDEASAYKDAQTKRHRLSRLIIGKKEYLWLMTGTPTPNAPTDAYGLAKLVNNAYGKSFTTFQNESMFKVSNFIWKPQKDGYEKAKQLLSPSIRFDIKDVWGGPKLTTQQREVPLTAQQKQLMADLKKDLQVVVKSGQPITATNEAAARQKFMQISLGAIYDSGHKAHRVDAAPRINELKEIIQQAPGKLLILVPLTSVVNLLYKELDGWTREVVNGEVSQKERSRIFQAFQSEQSPRLLIADPGTMAHGLDLWMAQTVVWYGPTDKTELYLQANKRAHRPGQKFPVTVVQLVSNKLEQEIYRRLENNTSLQGTLLDMVRKGEL